MTLVANEPLILPPSIQGLPTLQDEFCSNGLLEDSPSGAGRTSEEGSWILGLSDHGKLSSDTAFPILDGSSHTQDDDFPDVSELLKPYAGRGVHRADRVSKASSMEGLPDSLRHAYIRAATCEGKTVYLKRRSRFKALVDNLDTRTKFASLLEVPIHRMMDELSAATAVSLEAPSVSATKNNNHEADMTDNVLLVDRYRPTRFTELVGNERVARDVLRWVKLWDRCVFGRRRLNKRVKEEDEYLDPDDEYHRPREKILLLSGPPGLGKTTLAHVVARQAGYEVMEINASDARTGHIIDDRLRPALESGSAVGSTKPVLIVIDEIDGATGTEDASFISKLVQLTQVKWGKRARPGAKRNSKDQRPLRRPIICICNDLNAASLARLRPHAYQVRVPRPADIHVVKRLREICEMESLKAESRALSTLAGIAKGDLRGCLNALQFIKARNGNVTEGVIRAATSGMKEVDSSASTVLNSLFAPMTRKRVKDLGLSEEAEAKYVARLSREVESSGRDASIAAGCFAHYITLHQHDAAFSRHQKANEWLVIYDALSGKMYSDAIYELSHYLPYMLVPFYPLFQERGQRMEKSQADWENLQQTLANEEIYKSLARCGTTSSLRRGAYRQLLSKPVLQLEFAPFINRIISPPLRPVNSQVIKPEERAVLARLVNIMVALELRFVQEKNQDGQLVYRLDPPIDVFITYDGKRAADIAISRYAVRHLVASEVDAKLIARQSHKVEESLGGQRGLDDQVDDGEPRSKRTREEAIDLADKAPVDFFGRPILNPTSNSAKRSKFEKVERKFRVTYHYREGNCAAVRRPVKVSTFAWSQRGTSVRTTSRTKPDFQLRHIRRSFPQNIHLPAPHLGAPRPHQ